MYQITGNTYPHRARLKALGCTWNPVEKAWETGNPATYQQALEVIGATKQGALPFIHNAADWGDDPLGAWHGRNY